MNDNGVGPLSSQFTSSKTKTKKANIKILSIKEWKDNIKEPLP